MPEAESTADSKPTMVLSLKLCKDVWAWWLLIHWLQFQFTHCEALPSELALLESILKLSIIPIACAHFPTQFLPSSQMCIWYALIQHSLNSHPFHEWPYVTYPLCGGCQWLSSGPLPSQQCSPLLWFQRTRDTQNVYCTGVNLLKLKRKYSILRYWFLTFISCEL